MHVQGMQDAEQGLHHGAPPRRRGQPSLLDDEEVEVAGAARPVDRIGAEDAHRQRTASGHDALDDAPDIRIGQHQAILYETTSTMSWNFVASSRGWPLLVDPSAAGTLVSGTTRVNDCGGLMAVMPASALSAAIGVPPPVLPGTWAIVSPAAVPPVGPSVAGIVVPAAGASVSTKLTTMSVISGLPWLENGS